MLEGLRGHAYSDLGLRVVAHETSDNPSCYSDANLSQKRCNSDILVTSIRTS